ncbi:MAG: hypothetical protein KIT16_23680 [Rhodospirillaceae bacterium]|nr:hypothetical protein [Rhodospirillaceae bacterium]
MRVLGLDFNREWQMKIGALLSFAAVAFLRRSRFRLSAFLGRAAGHRLEDGASGIRARIGGGGEGGSWAFTQSMAAPKTC